MGRCMHLSEVCSQVWPRHLELQWVQTGSNPEDGGRGNEEDSHTHTHTHSPGGSVMTF